MKISSKPISSPSRTDKFPTPLMMRFLRSNVGSRSRGRSRSSPMFIMRTKKNAAAIGDTAQAEPSSPKVTCIGQVRARRSSKAKSSKSKKKTTNKQVSRHHRCLCSCTCSSSASSAGGGGGCCCCCIPKTQICCHFRPKFRKPRLYFRSFFRKWVLFFRFGYCKKIDARDDSIVSIQRSHNHNHVSSAIINAVDVEGDDDDEVVTVISRNSFKKEDFRESSSSPPKNALLLTRCRSAPYRSSSLAGRFWGSPLRTSETETETLKDDEEFKEEHMDGASGKPNSPISGNEAAEAEDSRNSSSHEEELSSTEDLDSSSNERTQPQESSSNIKDCRGGGGGGSVHPLLLMRCKSEPARTGERLIPEVNFSGQRRSDTTQSCLQEK